MRTKNGTKGLCGLLAICAMCGVACRSLPDCGDGDELDGLLCPSATGGGVGGAGGGVPASCVPSEAGEPVAGDCGVFVSSSAGDDANAGTKEAPVRTLAAAVGVAAAAGKPIYACAEELLENGGVTVPAGLSIYGGLDCAKAWVYAGGARTVVTAPADVIPLRLSGGEGSIRLEDLHVVAAPAAAFSGSSIAVVVDGVPATFVRSILEAGDGMAGENAAPFGLPAATGTAGASGGAACSAATVAGALGPTNACSDEDSVGGDGGNGLGNSGGPGFSGLPSYEMNGGEGESLVSECEPGASGKDGMDGVAGADGAGLGAIDSTGFAGVAGADGAPGKVGQGGGGGGGSKGGTGAGACMAGGPGGGASGGSGGSGGCGGAGGKGGGYGGSSIALVSLNAMLSFEDTELRAKNGGAGGMGGSGQVGGKGGVGGSGGMSVGLLKAGCAGGAGGNGGEGGPGGGGAGGHSIGIAFKGAAPPAEGLVVTVGSAGLGGGTADAGSAQETQEFP